VRISVVVPTFRRQEALEHCLDALERQSRVADEVLVVARVEDEESRAVIGSRQAAQLVAIEVPEGRPGFVAALNAGLAASTGDIVCFTDDDAEPHPDWIERIVTTFGLDPAIAAVGGRDWVYFGDRLDGDEESRVGTVSWWGRSVGNHHQGVGPARDVDVLKGVNLSLRGDVARPLGFDTRLRGRATEHHSEMGLCLALLRMGYRVIYDPSIGVDHRPRPRVAEDRQRNPRDVGDAAHNESLALLEHLSPAGRVVHLLWVTLVGSRLTPGLAVALREGPALPAALPALRANLDGRRRAIGTRLRPRGSRAVTALTEPGRNRVLAVAQSAGGVERAQQLLEGDAAATIVERPLGSVGLKRAIRIALSASVDTLYVVDVGRQTTAAAVAGRLAGRRVIVDTGDAAFALARSLGDRGPLDLASVRVGEELALRAAHHVVIRGRQHRQLIPGPATHIPDLPPPGAAPVPDSELKHALGLDGAFVVGLVGSLILSTRHRISYGWDLIEALALTDDSVVALVVGDGSGLKSLETRAAELGVLARCRFVGRVRVERVASYVSAMDAAISTQTNDIVGNVRTTGKLPLYLVCGCPVLATDVGEASVLLSPLGWTLPYAGVVDPGYPRRLAAAIEAWRQSPELHAARRQHALEIVRESFDVAEMRQRLAAVLREPSRAPGRSATETATGPNRADGVDSPSPPSRT
jgi:Glycosyl transferase family 2/Glycosyl transferases group 1